ncbi:MAG TPA: cupredoxin family copper-binding protein [Candidatus Saccharimonadia bacterium]
MKRSPTAIAVAVIVLVVIIAAAAYALNRTRQSVTQLASPTPTPLPTLAAAPVTATAATAASTPAPSAITVKASIKDMAFSPAGLTVKAGTTVTWKNEDSVSHNVVETDGQAGPSSGTLANGQTYSFAFSTPGTYHYHCSIHPSMTGTVTVTP